MGLLDRLNSVNTIENKKYFEAIKNKSMKIFAILNDVNAEFYIINNSKLEIQYSCKKDVVDNMINKNNSKLIIQQALNDKFNYKISEVCFVCTYKETWLSLLKNIFNNDTVEELFGMYYNTVDFEKDVKFNPETNTIDIWTNDIPEYICEIELGNFITHIANSGFIERTTKIYYTINFYKKIDIDDIYFKYTNGCLDMDYNKYLSTYHWKHFRKEAYKFYNYECSLCKSKDNLNLHHKNYDNLGRETFNDVILLCNKCHKIHHGK
jgi:hypothetical protein